MDKVISLIPQHLSVGFSLAHNSYQANLAGAPVTQTLGTQKSLNLNGDFNLYKGLYFGFQGNYNLSKPAVRKGKKNIFSKLNIKYNHDCFEVTGSVEKSDIQRGDIKPEIIKGLRISLKTLN